jgi:D-cysteine desulfhydrase family pyridoxal phosphate-dependent enzyme
VPLAHAPTPLEPADRLARALAGDAPAPRLLVKRDDATGLAGGGNKTRKLEYLLGQARAEGADSLITTGGVQSNHVRQTAAAAAALDLHCELVLTRNVPDRPAEYFETGNLQLDRLLGAKVHLHAGDADRARLMAELAEAARERGRRPFVIPLGGSTAVGALGYVRAAMELVAQAAERDQPIDRIVHACSSGGTLAGLVVGLHLLGHPAQAIGIDVEGDAAATEATVRQVVQDTAALLQVASPPAEAVRVVGGWAGPSYGVPTEAMAAAVRTAARSGGLLLDPVYTGKALAGLGGLIAAGDIAADETVAFLHTGGMPALFAYRDAFEG